jgi:hypothetical protein
MGLFVYALASKTLCLKVKKCSGRKLSKERLTVFLYGFMTGEKKKPLITDNAAKP